jgi:hypothetical protein
VRPGPRAGPAPQPRIGGRTLRPAWVHGVPTQKQDRLSIATQDPLVAQKRARRAALETAAFTNQRAPRHRDWGLALPLLRAGGELKQLRRRRGCWGDKPELSPAVRHLTNGYTGRAFSCTMGWWSG